MSFYTHGQFLDFCQKVFGDIQPAGQENIQIVCPFCLANKGAHYNKKKLALHLDTQILHCWVCGYKSKNLLHLLQKFHQEFLVEYVKVFCKGKTLEVLEQIQENGAQKREKISLPSDFILLAGEMGSDDWRIRHSLNYLKARGVATQEELWQWRLGISPDVIGLRGRIIVPSFNVSGELDYYTARTMNDSYKPKYKNPEVPREEIVFNEINLDWKKELTIVEGIFDLFKCDLNAVPLLGSDLSGEYRLFQKITENRTPVVLALDPEAHRKSLRIAKRLAEFDVPVRILSYQNTTAGDVGEMTTEEFKALKCHAMVFDTEYYLKEKISNIV